MKMNTKGVSLIISWVLLIGFAVTLGVIVSQWMQDQANKTAETVIEAKAQEVRCRDVSLNAFLTNSCATLEVANKGVFTVHQINIRSKFGTEAIDTSILPSQSQSLNIQTALSPDDSIEVIPVIEMEETLVSCVTRKTVANCEQ